MILQEFAEQIMQLARSQYEAFQMLNFAALVFCSCLEKEDLIQDESSIRMFVRRYLTSAPDTIKASLRLITGNSIMQLFSEKSEYMASVPSDA